MQSTLNGGISAAANPASLTPNELFNRLFPAQLYKPTRTADDYQAIADAFNAAHVPVVFNAYNIAQGQELLFCNNPAMDFLQESPSSSTAHTVPGRTAETRYAPIDAEAVQSALWLVLYGFGHRYKGDAVIDGAYHRQLIIAELAMCDVIYAVKPQNAAWSASPPANYFEVQDFNTEMWFNSSFAAEVSALQKAVSPPRIVPITMDHPLGYWNYFVEKTENYTAAYNAATQLLEGHHSAFRTRTSAVVVSDPQD
jgi:hypothetical protein